MRTTKQQHQNSYIGYYHGIFINPHSYIGYFYGIFINPHTVKSYLLYMLDINLYSINSYQINIKLLMDHKVQISN